ncbi:MAG: hypothetical protein VYC17_01060, partial [Nitrospinota bacterium]|nr:hypothetical protein [Nitrospinota bacterium]
MSPDNLFATWGSRFKAEIVWPDVKEDVVRAFLRYLADLGVFHSPDGQSWSMPGLDVVPIRSDILKHLQKLCSTEEGFAVGYFLVGGPESNPSQIPSELAGILQGENECASQELDVKRPSDLSKVQIVKHTASRIDPCRA